MDVHTTIALALEAGNLGNHMAVAWGQKATSSSIYKVLTHCKGAQEVCVQALVGHAKEDHRQNIFAVVPQGQEAHEIDLHITVARG